MTISSKEIIFLESLIKNLSSPHRLVNIETKNKTKVFYPGCKSFQPKSGELEYEISNIIYKHPIKYDKLVALPNKFVERGEFISWVEDVTDEKAKLLKKAFPSLTDKISIDKIKSKMTEYRYDFLLRNGFYFDNGIGYDFVNNLGCINTLIENRRDIIKTAESILSEEHSISENEQDWEGFNKRLSIIISSHLLTLR